MRGGVSTLLASVGPLVMLWLGLSYLSWRPTCGDSFRNAITTLVVGAVVVGVGTAVMVFAATL